MAWPTTPLKWADGTINYKTEIDPGLRDTGFPPGAVVPAGENNQALSELYAAAAEAKSVTDANTAAIGVLTPKLNTLYALYGGVAEYKRRIAPHQIGAQNTSNPVPIVYSTIDTRGSFLVGPAGAISDGSAMAYYSDLFLLPGQKIVVVTDISDGSCNIHCDALADETAPANSTVVDETISVNSSTQTATFTVASVIGGTIREFTGGFCMMRLSFSSTGMDQCSVFVYIEPQP